MFYIVLLILGLTFSMSVMSKDIVHPQVISFEDSSIPKYLSCTKSELKISDKHYRIGKKSLCWKFDEGGTLSINKDLEFKPDIENNGLYISTFITWVYNEKPIDDYATFNFYKGEKLCATFKMNLNFRGWRSAWIAYERDMIGIPEKGMDKLVIVAPNKPGDLFLDHMITSSLVDSRHQTPDLQIPFVNKGTDNHWMRIYKYSQLKSDLQLEEMTNEDIQDMKIIEQRFKDTLYRSCSLNEKQYNSILQIYESYNIKYTNGIVTGNPIFYSAASQAYEKLIPPIDLRADKSYKDMMKNYLGFMQQVASAYNNTVNVSRRKTLAKIFLGLYDNITDQGVAYGSCFGNIHHYGYAFRSYYTSLFLMKEVLRKAGRLEEASKSMQWYAITNEIYKKPMINGVSMDALNTTTIGKLASILIMEDSPKKIRFLKSYKRWLDYGCKPSPGILDAFKSDGAGFHHANIYPAYTIGGLQGATDMINLLSRTKFAVCKEAHDTVKKVMLAMRFYSNTLYYPLILSARHPIGTGAICSDIYLKMAFAGTPDGKCDVDKEMVKAFLRLYAAEDRKKSNAIEEKLIKELKKLGYTAEKDPVGNMALGYGCLSVHRRDNWCITVRGHSRYLWGSEHYNGANLYGRYLGFGTMNLMAPRNEGGISTLLSSGWKEEGFDWGRVPGSTAIHFPIEKLKADVKKVDIFAGEEEMLLSDEYFAGGLSQQESNGNFGMILHEHDKYNGSHRAKKSYHFFDEEIICLGSNIENDVKDYPTETTIFQLNLEKESDKHYWKESLVDNYCMDHLGNGYYFPKRISNNILYNKDLQQQSRRSTDGQVTVDSWVTLSINHGFAPQNGEYEYAILPKTKKEKLEKLAVNPDYEVLKKDRQAHIVKRGLTTSYVLFEQVEILPKGLVHKTDIPCLLMVKEDTKTTVLTVCNPDLALYRGKSDEKFDENGKRIERSVYSRDWIANESMSVPVLVTLRGSWNIVETDHIKIIDKTKEKTIVKVNCREGKSLDIFLSK